VRGITPIDPVAITPEDTGRLGIRTGDLAWIETPGGRGHATRMLPHGVMPGALAIAHGYGHRENSAPAPVASAQPPSLPSTVPPPTSSSTTSASPIGVLNFPGTGIEDNLSDTAKRLDIPVWKFGGARASPYPSISGRNIDRRLMILPETMNTPSPV
jgi:hypothetical protein